MFSRRKMMLGKKVHDTHIIIKLMTCISMLCINNRAEITIITFTNLYIIKLRCSAVGNLCVYVCI